jgi:hypothetical protein
MVGDSQPSCPREARTAQVLKTHRKQLWVEQRELNDLAQLANLLPETADTGKRRSSWVLERHAVDKRVDLPRQDAHDRQGRHVE